MSAPVEALFQPFRLGALELPTRVVMAPMTRNFSPGGVPNAKVVEYYRRRAAAGVGLIVSEGTTVGHKAANGYPNVPRFYGEDALAGWKQVVDAVHAEGGASFRSSGTSAAFGAWAWSRTPACPATARWRRPRTARCWSTA